MKKKNLPYVFWLLVANFLIIVLRSLLIPLTGVGAPFIMLFYLTFITLGIVFLRLVSKEKPEKRLKKFLLLTGFSPIGIFVFIILHNLLYALGVVTKDIAVIFYISEVLHVAFFLIAVIVCPIGFIVGVIGSSILLRKK